MIWTILDIIAIIAMLAIGHGIWYVFSGLDCWVGGLAHDRQGNPIKSELLPYYGWWQDTLYLVCPWKKTEHIRSYVDCSIVSDQSTMGDYTYKEIRERNLYAWVAWKELPGPIHYVSTHIVLPLIPLGLYLATTRWLL